MVHKIISDEIIIYIFIFFINFKNSENNFAYTLYICSHLLEMWGGGIQSTCK